MNVIIIVLSVFIAANTCQSSCVPTLTTVSGVYAPTGQICSGQLLFDETFDSLNYNLWNHEIWLGGYNGEFHWYTNDTENSFTENGILNLLPTLTTEIYPDLTSCQINLVGCTDVSGSMCSRTCSPTNIAPPVRSALLRTDGKFNFKYGRIVISAKMPSGKWLWPAMWLLPFNNTYGIWPRSGEIDVVESRGNDNLVSNGLNIGAEQFGTTLHFGPAWNEDGWATATQTVQAAVAGQGFDTAFHEYETEWSPDHIQLSLDGVLKVNFTTGAGYFSRGGFTGDNPWEGHGLDAPFDQEFYFILNNAIGGTNGYFPDGLDNKPWQNSDGAQAESNFWNGRADWLRTWNSDVTAVRTSALQVDYVRLYAI